MKRLADQALTLNLIMSELKEMDLSESPVIKIAFLRNVTVEPIKPYIEYFMGKMGLKAELFFADYDNIMQEVLNPQSELYNFSPDIIILASKLEKLSADLVYNHASLDPNSLEDHKSTIVGTYEQIFTSIRENSSATIFFHNFETPLAPSLGVLDTQMISGQVNLVRRLNMELVDTASKFSDCYIIDVDLIQSKVGVEQYFDRRYWHIGKAPYSKNAYPLIAKEYSNRVIC